MFAMPALATANDATEHHFTQKEHDAESGNDYFLARYYTSGLGRFTTPDWSAQIVPVPYANLGDPQSLNLYAYVRNNPLTRMDADGHCDGWVCEEVIASAGQKRLDELAQQNAMQDQQAQQAQQQSGSSKGSGFWHGLNNLLHGHSWSYIKTTVTTTQTYTIGGWHTLRDADLPQMRVPHPFGPRLAERVGTTYTRSSP